MVPLHLNAMFDCQTFDCHNSACPSRWGGNPMRDVLPQNLSELPETIPGCVRPLIQFIAYPGPQGKRSILLLRCFCNFHLLLQGTLKPLMANGVGWRPDPEADSGSFQKSFATQH